MAGKIRQISRSISRFLLPRRTIVFQQAENAVNWVISYSVMRPLPVTVATSASPETASNSRSDHRNDQRTHFLSLLSFLRPSLSLSHRRPPRCAPPSPLPSHLRQPSPTPGHQTTPCTAATLAGGRRALPRRNPLLLCNNLPRFRHHRRLSTTVHRLSTAQTPSAASDVAGALPDVHLSAAKASARSKPSDLVSSSVFMKRREDCQALSKPSDLVSSSVFMKRREDCQVKSFMMDTGTRSEDDRLEFEAL